MNLDVISNSFIKVDNSIIDAWKQGRKCCDKSQCDLNLSVDY